MKSFEQYLIFVPHLFQDREYGTFIDLRERIYLDETSEKLIFDASFSPNRPKITTISFLRNIYASMVAFAFSVGWIERPAGPSENQKREKDGVINNKKVATIVGSGNIPLTDHVELDKDQIQEVANRFFSSPRGNFWEKLTKAEITLDESYIELNSVEREALIALAKKVADGRRPTMTRGQSVYYDFSEADLSFAPNTAWGFWALARTKDEKIWQRTTLTMDYKHKTCRIVWQKK